MNVPGSSSKPSRRRTDQGSRMPWQPARKLHGNPFWARQCAGHLAVQLAPVAWMGAFLSSRSIDQCPRLHGVARHYRRHELRRLGIRHSGSRRSGTCRRHSPHHPVRRPKARQAGVQQIEGEVMTWKRSLPFRLWARTRTFTLTPEAAHTRLRVTEDHRGLLHSLLKAPRRRSVPGQVHRSCQDPLGDTRPGLLKDHKVRGRAAHRRGGGRRPGPARGTRRSIQRIRQARGAPD